MNDLAALDLFGREGSFLYAPEYLVFFAIAVLTAIILPIMLKRLPKEKVRKLLIGLWIFCLVYDIVKYLISWSGYITDGNPFNFTTALPLHTCSTFWYVPAIALFAKNERSKNAAMCYLCTINMFGGIVGMFMATDMMSCYSMFSLYGSQTMIYHALLFIFPSIMLVTGYYRPKAEHLKWGYALFLCIAIPVFIFDNIFKADYMYIYDSSLLGIFKPIADAMPHRLLWTLIAFAAYFIIAVVFLFAEMGIIALCERNKKAIASPAELHKEELSEIK